MQDVERENYSGLASWANVLHLVRNRLVKEETLIGPAQLRHWTPEIKDETLHRMAILRCNASAPDPAGLSGGAVSGFEAHAPLTTLLARYSHQCLFQNFPNYNILSRGNH